MSEEDLDDIADRSTPDPELHELADAVQTDADADAGDDHGGHDHHDHDHDGHDHDHGHGGHDDHDDHPAEDPRWVLLPLLVGAVIGLIVVVVLGFASGAHPLA